MVLRLLYLQKRESLAANADEVLVTVEEVQTELQKMNLPRRLDQKTLENLMRTLRRYNLARSVGGFPGWTAALKYFPQCCWPCRMPTLRMPPPKRAHPHRAWPL